MNATTKQNKNIMSVKTKKRMTGRFSYLAAIYSMMVIPLLQIIIFHYLPMFGVVLAFKDYRFNLGILGSPWVGFKNFEFFLKSNDFLIVARNTIGLNVLFLVATTIADLTLAVLLYNLISRKTAKIVQSMYITPNFVGWVVVAYIVYAFLNPAYGILNKMLENLGLEGINWYNEPKYWPLILTVAKIWKGVGMGSIVYYAALMGIDNGLLEAAEIDGANKWQMTIHVMIPTIVPLIVIMTILSVGGIFRGDFGMFYQLPMDSAALYPVTDVVNTYVYRTMRETNNMSLTTAIGFLQSVVGIIMVTFTNWASKKVDKDLGLF